MAPVALLALGLLAGAEPAPPQLSCPSLPAVIAELSRHHYAKKEVIPAARDRVADQLIKALDPSKTLFLRAEAAALKAEIPKVFLGMTRGDCSALNRAARLVRERAREDEDIARELLSDPKYKLDDSVELVLRAKKRKFAKTPAARRDLVRRMIQFQISNELLSGNKLALAKEHVLHRYELATKRKKERREDADMPELFAEAYAASLDPHSAFLTPEVLADFQIAMRLSLEGIGAVLRSEDGFVRIQELIPGGQADKQNKLRVKDKLVGVAQEGEPSVSLIDMDLRDAVRLIRGPKGSKVTLTVLREGPPTKTFDVTIVRDKIDVKESAAKIRYETRKRGKRRVKIGVLELPSFYGSRDGRTSYTDVKRLVAEAKKAGVDGLVLDLSRNGGGLLQDAVRISGLFLKQGAVVGTREVTQGFTVLEDEDPALQYAGPLLVLVSPASASASEIVAGALDAYGRAIIAGGAHSFGKGTVQQLSPLPADLGAIKVTTGMFFLPSGHSTQREGVQAQIRIPSVMDGIETGEKDLDYSLPPGAVPAFRSTEANLRRGGFKRVNPKKLPKLRARSKARVAKNPIFKKLRAELAEEQKDKVKLSELRKQTDKADVDEDAAKARYEARHKAFQDEGVNILVDSLR